MKKNRFGVILTSTALMLGATLATRERDAGAETNPRDYSALLSLPSHTVIFLGYYRHVSSSDTTSLSQDLELFRAAYTLKWNHFVLAPIDLILPVADTTVHVPIPNGGGLSGALHNSGIGDLSFLPTAVYEIPEGDWWSTFLGASTYVTLPTGNYKDTQPINAGAHRWNFKQELMAGESLPRDQTIEALVNITDYTANDDFRAPTKDIHSLHQLPTLGLEVHYFINLAPYFGVGASYYLAANGRSHLAYDDALTTTKQQTIQTVRPTVAIRVEKQTLLYLQFNQDIEASGGASITRWVGGRISHYF